MLEFKCLTLESVSMSNDICGPGDWVCGPDVGDRDGCSPESEMSPCMPSCDPND